MSEEALDYASQEYARIVRQLRDEEDAAWSSDDYIDNLGDIL